jgi:hypothetical protein
MPTLDLAMPTALFIVITLAMFLNKRVEKKLVATVEQKEFKTRDIILLVVFMAVMISIIAFTSMINPGGLVPNVLLLVFLTSYSMLLFTFSYVFTNLTRMRAQLISAAFGICSLIAGLISFLGPVSDGYTVFRAIAFFVFSAFCLGIVAFEQKNVITKARWYLAAQPPALFLLLFVFFAFLYNGSFNVWFPILLDAFGFTFAFLIILYLSSLFTWKTALVFAALLPILDTTLVFTGPMVAAAQTFTGLGLPVLVWLPKLPLFVTSTGAIQLSGLGLGDFFFAGVLSVQTFNKFGKKTALIATAAIALSFGIWEAFLPGIDAYFHIGGFPATVCIITGWAPIIALKLLFTRNQAAQVQVAAQPVEAPKDPSLPIQYKTLKQ